MTTFDEFFQRATGSRPYGYQQRLAERGLPQVLQAPTGTGKTEAAVLSWLWRRLHEDPVGTPRRLIFALPQRTLVEQTARRVRVWLENLGDEAREVALHIVMGGEGRTQGEWRIRMDQPAIVVGTVDSLVSKILNRGYGISRAIYPIDFALVTNGAQWVLDEIQLCPESTKTLRQVAAFADPNRTGSWPTAEPLALTCMSATVSAPLLDTVDNPPPDEQSIIRIETADRTGALARRLDAARTIRQLPVKPGETKSVAVAIRQRHRPGTLTLAVVNRVETARAIYEELRKGPTPCTLLHSRFRGIDRERLIDRVINEPGESDHIVVSTQVVEAGVDINATVLVTEAAPWPSMVQRAGRCNRTGEVADAELWWLSPAKAEPYEQADIDATISELDTLEGQAVSGEDLLRHDVATIEPAVSVIRQPDLLELFDTAQDLNGGDVDVTPYIRDAEDLDVQLAWARWEKTDDSGQPPADVKAPEARLRCRVPLGTLRVLARSKSVWRYKQGEGRWTRVTDGAPARPGEVLVMSAFDGCYDPVTGFDLSVTAVVPESPELLTRPNRAAGTDPTAGAEDAYRQDDTSVSQREWLSLQQHSEDARREAEELLHRISPDVPAEAKAAVALAAYVHDAGKSHHTWQDALCALATEEEREFVGAKGPWAKSRSDGELRFEGGVAFRHELASLLFLDGPLRPLLDGTPQPDLVRYLVLAHHGKLRVQVRGISDVDGKVLLGLRHGESVAVPGILRQAPAELTVELGQFELGNERSWTRAVLRLRDRYGPFVLAYLETLVRMADWRASENPTTSQQEAP
jgi:CRISPR-associated endonuclease/helicase Cas3